MAPQVENRMRHGDYVAEIHSDAEAGILRGVVILESGDAFDFVGRSADELPQAFAEAVAAFESGGGVGVDSGAGGGARA